MAVHIIRAVNLHGHLHHTISRKEDGRYDFRSQTILENDTPKFLVTMQKPTLLFEKDIFLVSAVWLIGNHHGDAALPNQWIEIPSNTSLILKAQITSHFHNAFWRRAKSQKLMLHRQPHPLLDWSIGDWYIGNWYIGDWYIGDWCIGDWGINWGIDWGIGDWGINWCIGDWGIGDWCINWCIGAFRLLRPFGN